MPRSTVVYFQYHACFNAVFVYFAVQKAVHCMYMTIVMIRASCVVVQTYLRKRLYFIEGLIKSLINLSVWLIYAVLHCISVRLDIAVALTRT